MLPAKFRCYCARVKNYTGGAISAFLLNRLWGIDLTLLELKQLLLKGLIPEAKIKAKGIVVTSGNQSQRPVAANREYQAERFGQLILKIIKDETRPGSIVLLDYDRRFQPAELEDVLADD